ncbi:putative RNA 2'-phosphotransferase [Geodermatophilus telluris]|uniref:Probable RNA 2'-phosphotransferase n=1 Tax=Geodermatophilus telluris TaxID=1190417 RepID=A0A1G6UKG3_9ACTN|nr:RNA 2'-phosphotransferase [Geodermatophilus telluris]SDD41842.1 putative RNA 2'-phosphotransferase [Geodermatophilus telluris]
MWHGGASGDDGPGEGFPRRTGPPDDAVPVVSAVDGTDVVRISKRLSFVLRHRPDSVGLALDEAGWVDVDALLAALAAHGLPLTRADLDRVVAGNDKRRFAYDTGGRRIRASQGHSVPVALGYPAEQPPDELFHGTSRRALPAVLAEGLRPGRRHAVHLSPDEATARAVGGRRGPAAVLRVDAAGLAATGAVFTRSANGVWLVDAVPPAFLAVLDG